MPIHSLACKSDDAMKCRVFIGNLPSDNVTKNDIRNIFLQYGSFVDCSIYKNFGFVQYDDEESANKAVSGTNKTVMLDRRLDVKIAAAGRKDGTTDKGEPGKARKRSINPKSVHPLMSRQPYNPQMPYPPPPPPPQQFSMQPQNYDIPLNMPHAPPPQSPHPSTDSRVCDIICLSKKQLSYAEFVEFTMTRLGFVCNINLPSSGYSIESLLSRISKDGVPLAISLKDENESHRSLNLHIFIGNPEEHRNMPIDVAENFVKKRFSVSSTIPPTQASVSRSFSYSTQTQGQPTSAAEASNSQSFNTPTSTAGSAPYPAVPFYPQYRPPMPDPTLYQMQNPAYSQLPQAPFPQYSPYAALATAQVSKRP